MQAVVLSVKGNKAAVAVKGGTLMYIDDLGYEKGQILDIPNVKETPLTVFEGKKKTVPLWKRYTSSIAAAAVTLLFTGAVTAYALPVSTVTIDVNPSLSLGINLFDRVVRADYSNEDGRELLSDISPELIGKRLPDAVNVVFDGMEEHAYIDGKDIPAASTVTGIFPGRNRDRMMDELRMSADHWNKAHKDRSVSFEVEKMTPELKKEAHDKGMTPGQVMLERRMPEPPIEESAPYTPEKETVPDNAVNEMKQDKPVEENIPDMHVNNNIQEEPAAEEKPADTKKENSPDIPADNNNRAGNYDHANDNNSADPGKGLVPEIPADGNKPDNNFENPPVEGMPSDKPEGSDLNAPNEAPVDNNSLPPGNDVNTDRGENPGMPPDNNINTNPVNIPDTPPDFDDQSVTVPEMPGGAPGMPAQDFNPGDHDTGESTGKPEEHDGNRDHGDHGKEG